MQVCSVDRRSIAEASASITFADDDNAKRGLHNNQPALLHGTAIAEATLPKHVRIGDRALIWRRCFNNRQYSGVAKYKSLSVRLGSSPLHLHIRRLGDNNAKRGRHNNPPAFLHSDAIAEAARKMSSLAMLVSCGIALDRLNWVLSGWRDVTSPINQQQRNTTTRWQQHNNQPWRKLTKLASSSLESLVWQIGMFSVKTKA